MPISNMSNAEKTIRKARLNIIHKYRYFASVALMPIILDNSIDSMGTDAKYLYYNEDCINNWTYEEVYTVTLHEILHCIFMHIFRRKNRKRLFFQYAADYAINSFIRNYMNLRLPEPHLYDEKYLNMSTEEIYEDLVKPIQHNAYTRGISGHQGFQTDPDRAQNPYPDSSMFDPDNSQVNDFDPDLISDIPFADLSDLSNSPNLLDKDKTKNIETEELTSKAEILSKIVILRGEMLDPEPDDASAQNQALYRKNIKGAILGESSDMVEYLIKIIDNHKQVERIPWYHLLQNHVRDMVFGDYGFQTPNVRYVYSGFYLPAFRVKKIHKLSLVIDVSGSIVQRVDMLSDFFEHIRNIAEDVQIDNIEILTCNTRIIDKFTITSHELMFHNFDISGGGGTNLYPPLDYYDQNDSDNVSPDLMIYFTDLDGEFRKDPPDFPIIWVVIEHPSIPGKFLNAPYGTEVRYVP